MRKVPSVTVVVVLLGDLSAWIFFEDQGLEKPDSQYISRARSLWVIANHKRGLFVSTPKPILVARRALGGHRNRSLGSNYVETTTVRGMIS